MVGGMSTMFQTLAQGGKLTADTFKQMAASIGQSMLKVASDAAASGLFKLLLVGIDAAVGTTFSGPAAASVPYGPPPPPVAPVGHAAGGLISGGQITRDSVPILAMGGEYILNRNAVDAMGLHNIEAMNNGSLSSIDMRDGLSKRGSKDETSTVNIWLVSKDEVPNSIGPKDVIQIVSANIQQNGQIKQLIRSVQV
jgi:hypothetical protein